jgi:hypothetical protein
LEEIVKELLFARDEPHKASTEPELPVESIRIFGPNPIIPRRAGYGST